MVASTPQSRYTWAKSAEDYLQQRTLVLDNGCWEFTAGKDKDGYGQCHSCKYGEELQVTRAHQMSYVVHKGKIPEGNMICHTCDNPSCINPDHLFSGTNTDNMEDMKRKGRHRPGMTIEKGNCKLTNADVVYIHSQKGLKNCFILASELGVSFSRICQIWRKEYYGSNNTGL